MPGVTLALDFPIRAEVSFELLDRLAGITAEFGGRMYPAKDACMNAAHFQQFYPAVAAVLRLHRSLLQLQFLAKGNRP